MKVMKKKYLILLVLVAFFASCTDKFEEFNTDTKNPAIVTGEALFSNAQLALVDQISSTNVNLNVWKLFAQYWTETTYTDEANYDIINRSIPDNTFREYYRGFLKDFKEATEIITKTVPTSAVGEAEKTNKLAIIELMNVYAYQNLVDIFGNIPYSEAMDINNIAPKYDDAAIIYQDLIARIDAALAKLDDAQGSFGTADLIYGGDVASWIKFANSLKLKIGITLADANPTLAKATVEAAVSGGVFTSMLDNAYLYYLGAIHTNPIYQDVVQSGRNDFVAANTIVDLMNNLTDPRRPLYFTLTDTSSVPTVEKLAYLGGPYGAENPFTLYSHIAGEIIVPDFPGILLTYDEVLFYMAEAAARTWSVGGTDSELYDDAITASIITWGGTDADATAYLAQPGVAYATATGTWQQKIGTQAYIAFYTRGLEGYTEWRRMDFPIFNIAPSIDAYSKIPKRFTYPVNEQTLNKANYESASSAVGGDLLVTKLFWDKF
jgi:Starch-binding associating with outer membrane